MNSLFSLPSWLLINSLHLLLYCGVTRWTIIFMAYQQILSRITITFNGVAFQAGEEFGQVGFSHLLQ